MKRLAEKCLCRTMQVLACLCGVAGAGVVAAAFWLSPAPAQLPSIENAPCPRAPATLKRTMDPKLARLRLSPMSCVPAGAPVVERKTVLPPLHTLVRLNGVLDFGRAETREALIEDLRTGQTKPYKVGQKLEGIDATVRGIDTGVTLEYEGRSVRLELGRSDSQAAGSLAAPGEQPLKADQSVVKH